MLERGMKNNAASQGFLQEKPYIHAGTRAY